MQLSPKEHNEILILLSGFTKDKEFLSELIAKYETIPVALDYSSVITRSPHVGDSEKDNKAEFPKKLTKEILDTIIATLNDGFNTKAFYQLENSPKDKKQWKEQGHKFYVIVNLKGTYTVTSSTSPPYYIFSVAVSHYYYKVTDDGKVKMTSNGPSILTRYCESEKCTISMKLNEIMNRGNPECIKAPLCKEIRKKYTKFAQKQIAKAEKAK